MFHWHRRSEWKPRMALGVGKYLLRDRSFVFDGTKGGDEFMIQGPRTLLVTCFSHLFLVLFCLCHTIFFILADISFIQIVYYILALSGRHKVSLSVTATHGPWLLPHLIAMGACLSSPTALEVTEHDKVLHREAEKQLKEVRYYHQVVSRSRLTDRRRPRQRWRRKSRFVHPTSFDIFHSNTLIRGAGSASGIGGFRKVDSPQGAYLRNCCIRPH